MWSWLGGSWMRELLPSCIVRVWGRGISYNQSQIQVCSLVWITATRS